MSNDNNTKKPGPEGTFKVKLKSPGDGNKYLKREPDGGLKWDETGTDLHRDIVSDLPYTWYVLDGRKNKYLNVQGSVVQWSGDSEDRNWAFSGGKLSYGTTKYFKYKAGDAGPSLTESQNEATEIDTAVTTVHRSRLKLGEALVRGDELTSENGFYYAPLQRDGNFAVYRKKDDGTIVLVWSVYKTGGARLILQETDGNLVLYDGQGAYLWSPDKRNGAYAALQDDGNFVLCTENGGVLWSSW